MTAAWTRTNCREQHFRIDGRIVAKITRAPGEYLWMAQAKAASARPYRMIGCRRGETAARKLAEEAALRAARPADATS
jgi:hypothetical protein